MKKKISCVLLTVFLVMIMALTGCGKDEKSSGNSKETVQKSKTEEFMYNKLPASDTTYSAEDAEIIRQGINDWAKANLLVGTDVDEKTREKSDKKLYDMMVSSYDLKRMKADRKGFYNGTDVQIGLVETDMISAVQTTYEDKPVGSIQCATAFYGTKNGQTFTRVYNMKLVISYENQTVTVDEIGEISWM